jgi:PhnB protein
VAAVHPIPEGYPQVIPYLSVDGADGAIDFYVEVFGATERMRMVGPEDRVGHAEIEIGESLIMLADAFPEMGGTTPKALGGTPVTVMLYVKDVDAVVKKALSKGATLDREVTDQFYGDRAGQIEDPFGHKWFIATHVEDVSDEEVQRRAEATLQSDDNDSDSGEDNNNSDGDGDG